MKKIICSILLLLVVGCGSEPVKTFIGQVDVVSSEKMEIDCSSAVKVRTFKSDQNAVGYNCNVKITEQTKIYNLDDEEIDVDRFSSIATPNSRQYVEVTLVEAKDINENVESRKGLVAEIIRITEKD